MESKDIYFRKDLGNFLKTTIAPIHTTKPDRIESREDTEDVLFRNTRGLLIFGKIISVLPYSGVFGKNSKDIKFRPRSTTAWVSYTIAGLLLFSTSLATYEFLRAPKRNPLEIAYGIRRLAFYILGCYIYKIFIIRSEKFIRIFKAWEATKVVYAREDVHLFRDVTLISVVILTSAILENAIVQMIYFKELDYLTDSRLRDPMDRNRTSVEVYLHRSNPDWTRLLGYNWLVALMAFLVHKWVLYSENYVDVLIAVMARAIYFRFKALYEVAGKVLLGDRNAWVNGNEDKTEAYRDPKAWLQIVEDHRKLCRLLGVMETFFSPVIFMTFSLNMFHTCLQLLEGLTNEARNQSIIYSIYAPWSFVHLLLRMFAVSYSSAKINDYAHKIRELFVECPVECYTPKVSQLDKHVTSGPNIGFTGLQCFTITRSFILSIVGVVLTFEIVLLQCVPTSNSPTQLVNQPHTVNG